MHFRPDSYSAWRITCTRGASSVLIDVWVYAASYTAAVDKVRAAGYLPEMVQILTRINI